jgi:hypothetical protein
MPTSDYLGLIQDAVGGAAFDADQIARALTRAVWRYSKDRPRLLAWVRVSEDGHTVPLPPEWMDGVSAISHITAAVGGDIPAELTAADWEIAVTPDGRVIRFIPPLLPGAALDIAYTAAHVVDDEAGFDSVPPVDQAAVADWAAAKLLDAKAAAHAGDIPAVAGATALPGGGDSPARAYAARASELCRQYFEHMGIDPTAATKAAAARDDHDFACAEVGVAIDSPPGGRVFRRAAPIRRL